jgi:Lon protease-like protein
MDDELDLDDIGNVVRLFPLPGVVLFPHAVLPLHIFEPRYRQMTEDALGSDRLVTIVRVREPHTCGLEGNPAVEDVACVGRIVKCERLHGGRFNFLLLGLARVRLVRELHGPTPYRQAEVEVLRDEAPDDAGAALRAALVEQFRELARSQGVLDDDLEAMLGSSIPLGALSDIVAHALALPPPVKQGLLAETRVARRAETLVRILGELRDCSAERDAPPARRYPPPISLN